ncbi:hypothetical protein O3U67_14130 [Brevundimonas diminuta]|uniref:hypothetical protein n=1 Tax=Brevundimonas diminuta TaxID=293 RepID=UPI0022AE7D70|nr:hypothetical protein [Brevundimonas diminuta]MCZ4109230.1 hypothetical protein [Brevundimonas diminuta]
MAQQFLEPAQAVDFFWWEQKLKWAKLEPPRGFVHGFLRVALLSVPKVARFGPGPAEIALCVGLSLAAQLCPFRKIPAMAEF